jgi:hypothetical protein
MLAMKMSYCVTVESGMKVKGKKSASEEAEKPH